MNTFPTQSSNAPNTFTVSTTDGTAFTLVQGEVGFIQNLDGAPLAVKLGAGASTSSFSMILQAGVSADDGKGGFTYITDYIGPVTVAAMTGSPRFIAWERAIG